MFRGVIDGYLTGEAGPSGCIMISTSATSAVDDDAVRERLAAFLAMEDEQIEALLAARGDPQAHAHARSGDRGDPSPQRARPGRRHARRTGRNRCGRA